MATSKKSPRPTVRWTDDEVRRLLLKAPDIAKPLSNPDLRDLLLKTQKGVLVNSRRRPPDAIYVSLSTPPTRSVSPLREQIEKVSKAMEAGIYDGLDAGSADEQEEQSATAEGEPAVFRWSREERIRLAHDEEIKGLLGLSEKPANAVLVEALLRAQRRQLTRSRPRKSIQNAIYTKGGKKGLYQELRDSLRFQPKEPIKSMHAPLPEPEQTELEQQDQWLGDMEARAQAEDGVQALAGAIDVPTPQPLPERPAGSLGGALAGLIELTVAKLSAAIAQSINDTLSTAVADATNQLKQSNMDSIAELLGGPVAVDTPQTVAEKATQARAVADMAAEAIAPKVRGPRVDVVGLMNGQVAEVRKAVGDSFDLRFLTPEELDRRPLTAPVTLMLAGNVPHRTSDKIKAYTGRLINVNGRVSSVLKELQALAH